MTVILVALAWIGILVVFSNFWLFDRIIEWEYEHHREQWERDNKPTGLLRSVPKGCKPWKRGKSEQELYFKWLFKTPPWALESPNCRRWFAYRRIGALVANLIILILLLKLLK